jgi:hypothetical protein
VRFELADLDALAAEAYYDAELVGQIGAPCDQPPAQVVRDAWGRVLAYGGSGCAGINPGSLLVVLGNLVRAGQAIGAQLQTPETTDQLVFRPVFRYRVDALRYLSAAEAGERVTGQPQRGYDFNRDARGFAEIRLTVQWVDELAASDHLAAPRLGTTPIAAIVELDQDPAMLGADPKIIGGEYLDDSQTGANRLTVFPQLWRARDAALTSQPEDLEGLPAAEQTKRHNPYVDPTIVKQLVALGQQ